MLAVRPTRMGRESTHSDGRRFPGKPPGAAPLARAGATVVAGRAGPTPPEGDARTETRKPARGVRWRVCDVEDGAAVARLIHEVRPAAIFHLASHVRGTRELGAVLTTFRANLASTVHVLRRRRGRLFPG